MSGLGVNKVASTLQEDLMKLIGPTTPPTDDTSSKRNTHSEHTSNTFKQDMAHVQKPVRSRSHLKVLVDVNEFMFSLLLNI